MPTDYGKFSFLMTGFQYFILSYFHYCKYPSHDSYESGILMKTIFYQHIHELNFQNQNDICGYIGFNINFLKES